VIPPVEEIALAKALKVFIELNPRMTAAERCLGPELTRKAYGWASG
jgi:hypothetical protein